MPSWDIVGDGFPELLSRKRLISDLLLGLSVLVILSVAFDTYIEIPDDDPTLIRNIFLAVGLYLICLVLIVVMSETLLLSITKAVFLRLDAGEVILERFQKLIAVITAWWFSIYQPEIAKPLALFGLGMALVVYVVIDPLHTARDKQEKQANESTNH